jgi:hypothetical protein
MADQTTEQLEEELTKSEIQLYRWKSAAVYGPSICLLSNHFGRSPWIFGGLLFFPGSTLVFGDVGSLIGGFLVEKHAKQKKRNPKAVQTTIRAHLDQTLFRTIRRVGFVTAALMVTMLGIRKDPRKWSSSEIRLATCVMEVVGCFTYLVDWKYPSIPKWWPFKPFKQ